MSDFTFEQILSSEWNAKIIQIWRRIVAREIRKLGAEINPFTGKTKKTSLINTEPSKRNRKVVRIWGVHPNVADDPIQYPSLPREGWHTTRPYNAFIYGHWFRMDKGQEHWDSDGKGSIFKYPNVYNSSKKLDSYFYFESYFNYNGKLYGKILKNYYGCVPIYSKRSIPEMISDYPKLKDIIVNTFNQAYEQWRGNAL